MLSIRNKQGQHNVPKVILEGRVRFFSGAPKIGAYLFTSVPSASLFENFLNKMSVERGRMGVVFFLSPPKIAAEYTSNLHLPTVGYDDGNTKGEMAAVSGWCPSSIQRPSKWLVRLNTKNIYRRVYPLNLF